MKKKYKTNFYIIGIFVAIISGLFFLFSPIIITKKTIISEHTTNKIIGFQYISKSQLEISYLDNSNRIDRIPISESDYLEITSENKKLTIRKLKREFLSGKKDYYIEIEKEK